MLVYLCGEYIRLKPIDVKFLKAVGSKVNVIPLIAKADTLTKQELAVKKHEVCCCRCTGGARNCLIHELLSSSLPGISKNMKSKSIKCRKYLVPISHVAATSRTYAHLT